MVEKDPTLCFLESTVDLAIIHATADGVISHWRGAAQRLLGFAPDEAVGQSLSLFFTPEDIARGLDAHEIALALVQGRSEDDRWHVRKDGSRFWASGVVTRVSRADGTVGLCKFLRDKTDVRTQVELLEHAVATLKERLKADRQAITKMAHELRNPLMPIVTSIDLLQRPDAAHLAGRATTTLTQQVEVLKRLIDDLDELGTDADPLPHLQLEPVNLSGALSTLIDAFRLSADAEDRLVSLVLPAQDIWIRADPHRLQQILLNLLNNAAKYTAAGGRIDVNATIEGAMAVVRVDDDGIGIGAHMLPRIFDLFTREGRNPDVAGKGVGLAVVRQLAAAHGGVVDVRSPGFGLGSVFSLRLPLGAPRSTASESILDPSAG